MKKLQMNRVTLGTVENRNSKIACCSFKFCVVFRRLHLSVFQICLQVRLVVSYILTLSKAAVGLNLFPPVTTNRVASMATAQPYASPGDGIAGPACHTMQGCIFLLIWYWVLPRSLFSFRAEIFKVFLCRIIVCDARYHNKKVLILRLQYNQLNKSIYKEKAKNVLYKIAKIVYL